jgi:hypothetical protein
MEPNPYAGMLGGGGGGGGDKATSSASSSTSGNQFGGISGGGGEGISAIAVIGGVAIFILGLVGLVWAISRS